MVYHNDPLGPLLFNIFLIDQGFMQTILMSSRQHKKLDLLIEFWNSMFLKKFILKHIKTVWLWPCIQSKLFGYLSSFISYYLPFRLKWLEALPPELPIWLHHRPDMKLIVPPDTHPHCRIILWSFSQNVTIKNSIFFQKCTLLKLPG